MNKIISIHLGGRSYHVEELGYDTLRAYLDEAGRNLAENPDKAEIVRDLEQAIGEKCSRYLNAHKDVVTTEEVEKIIAEMGPVSGEEHPGSNSNVHKDPEPSYKKLYLIREGAVFGGVCTGIAAYLNIDVTIVRIIFVALTVMTGGGFIFAYIAAMILIPYANTSEEKAAARGLPFNAQELVNRARESYRSFAGGAHNGAHRWSEWRRQRHAYKERRQAEKIAVLRRAHSPLFGIISALLAVVWIAMLFSIITVGTIFGIMIPATIPVWVAIVILFVLFHAVTGPLQATRHHNYPYPDPWYAFVDGIGILFIATAFAFCYIHYPSVQEFVKNIPQNIADFLAQ